MHDETNEVDETTYDLKIKLGLGNLRTLNRAEARHLKTARAALDRKDYDGAATELAAMDVLDTRRDGAYRDSCIDPFVEVKAIDLTPALIERMPAELAAVERLNKHESWLLDAAQKSFDGDREWLESLLDRLDAVGDRTPYVVGYAHPRAGGPDYLARLTMDRGYLQSLLTAVAEARLAVEECLAKGDEVPFYFETEVEEAREVLRRELAMEFGGRLELVMQTKAMRWDDDWSVDGSADVDEIREVWAQAMCFHELYLAVGGHEKAEWVMGEYRRVYREKVSGKPRGTRRKTAKAAAEVQVTQ